MWLKSEVEYQKGKIRFDSSGYSFGERGFTNKNGVHFVSIPSSDGRMIALNGKRSVNYCPGYEGMPDVPDTRRGYSVPMATCKRCEHYIRGGYCKIMRKSRAIGGGI
jgi:hypothetical protein